MNSQTRMELTRQLEKMRLSTVGANSRWLFVLGAISEMIGGAVLISLAIRFTVVAVSEDRLFWVGYLLLLMGILAIAHSGYLVFKRSLNRRLQSLYEAVLESGTVLES
jgi:uncharacterized membrane protein HdeD (DUF308 family)